MNPNMMVTVMRTTPDGAPYVGKVPGKQSQWILAGFNGGGDALAYLSAKAVVKMVIDGVSLRESGVEVPSMFETTKERLGMVRRNSGIPSGRSSAKKPWSGAYMCYSARM